VGPGGVTVRLAITNQKGGVGKTTTAINLGSALGKRKHRVLLVDLDPQANATSGLGQPKDMLESMYQVLLEGIPIEAVIAQSGFAGLDLAPSSNAMAGAEVELVPQLARESRLRDALRPLDGQYDVVLVDCPPSLGLLTVNALTACSHVLIPLQCEYFSLEGLAQLMSAIELVQERLNPALRVFGVLMTMEDRRNRLSTQVIQDVRRHFPRELFHTRIPRSVRLAEAPSHGKPADEYDAPSRGARAYGDLAREVLTRLRSEPSVELATPAVAHG
jgi:chromosome partitioning protein